MKKKKAEETEKPNIIELLQKDLQALEEKYQLYDCAFCGSSMDGKFIALMLSPKTVKEFFATTMNVGRLWQWARDSTNRELDTFDKRK